MSYLSYLMDNLPLLVAAVVFLVFVGRSAGKYRQAVVQSIALQKEAVALQNETIADQRKILDTLLEIKLALKGERN